MPHEPTFEDLLKDIGGLINISPTDFSTASERSEAMCKSIKEFKDVIELDARQRGSLDRLFASVDRANKQLAQSVLNLREDGRLRGDWARFAQRDLIRLKDEILALQEFLVANAKSFKLSSRTIAKLNIDLEKLLKLLHDENAISERTFVMLTTHLAQNGRSKLKDPKIIEQVSRISAYLSELREIRRVSSDA
jgi:uncharacterized membrane protein YgaE (UPF0421/DUF939 family)